MVKWSKRSSGHVAAKRRGLAALAVGASEGLAATSAGSASDGNGKTL
jgi:hypothetical protein